MSLSSHVVKWDIQLPHVALEKMLERLKAEQGVAGKWVWNLDY